MGIRVKCADVFTDDLANTYVANTKALAGAGQVMAEGNNGIDKGRIVPFNGFAVDKTTNGSWGNGTGSGAHYQDRYETEQQFLSTNVFTHWSLQAHLKLYYWNGSGVHRFGRVKFMIRVPGGGPVQTLVTVKSNNFIASPGEISIPVETPWDIRETGPINPTLIPGPGQAIELECVTEICHSVGNTMCSSGGISGRLIENSTYPNYWAGILFYQLKFFSVCPP